MGFWQVVKKESFSYVNPVLVKPLLEILHEAFFANVIKENEVTDSRLR